MKNTENEKTPERPYGSEQINAVIGTFALTVIPIGTNVEIKLSKFKGIITAINIRRGRIVYEVSHYAGETYTEIYLEDYQFVIIDKNIEKQEIGFNANCR